MCSPLSPASSLPALWQQSLRLHTLSVIYMAAIAQNWLTLLSGSTQSARLRTPLLRLQVQSRRLTPRPPSSEPRRNLWLVR